MQFDASARAAFAAVAALFLAATLLMTMRMESSAVTDGSSSSAHAVE